MDKIEKQITVAGKTLLLFDSPVPMKRFTKLLIDGIEYDPIIAFDIRDAYAVNGAGDFEGKEVEFI